MPNGPDLNVLPSLVKKVADFCMQGARKFTDQTYLSPPWPQADLIPAV